MLILEGFICHKASIPNKIPEVSIVSNHKLSAIQGPLSNKKARLPSCIIAKKRAINGPSNIGLNKNDSRLACLLTNRPDNASSEFDYRESVQS